jgi:hypothetical protein
VVSSFVRNELNKSLSHYYYYYYYYYKLIDDDDVVVVVVVVAAAAVVPSSQLFTYANLHETDIKACRASSNNSVTMSERCTLPVLNYCAFLGDFF